MDIQDIIEKLKIKYPEYCKGGDFLGLTILVDGSGEIIHGINDMVLEYFNSICDLSNKLNDTDNP